MNDSSSTPPPHGGPTYSMPIQKTQKRGRRATKLKDLTAKRQYGEKAEVGFDEFTGQPTGEYATKFKSYMGVLARTKVSILHPDWNHVESDVKNLIWQDIVETFNVPNDELLKKRWISYAGERWKEFKTTLTRTHIYGDKGSPCEKYPFISEDTWRRFVEMREQPEFQEKRQKAKENQAKNKCPHRLSRGGYQKLKETIKQHHLEETPDGSGDDSASIGDPPSPPRHELWKRARLKPSGEYTSETAALVAKKIESLVEKSTEAFVPHGRQDILTTAIGTPEHPGRVRAAGRGVGLRKYFGPPSRHDYTLEDVFGEQLASIKESIKAEWQAEWRVEISRAIDELKKVAVENLHVQPVNSPKATVSVSTDGSCAAAASNEKEWPQEQPQLTPVQKLVLKLLEFKGQNASLPLEHDKLPFFFIDSKEIMDLCTSENWLSISIIQLWCTYLHRLCIMRGNGDVYGILDPYMISNSADRSAEAIQSYIQNKLHELKKQIYLAPYLHENNFQLMIICPGNNNVVWMSSLNHKPDAVIQRIVKQAMLGYRKTKGYRKKNPTWLYPKSPLQAQGWECGHYVMRNMLTIVLANIVDSWEKMFDNESTFSEADIDNNRQRWATFFLEYYSQNKR